jgi:hypothetical protein
MEDYQDEEYEIARVTRRKCLGARSTAWDPGIRPELRLRRRRDSDSQWEWKA